MKGNIAQLMQQAQKMQENLKQAQQELAQLEITGQSGGGMVKITMNGRHEISKVVIDPSVGDDLEMLEDLIAAACNDAVNRIQEVSQEKMSGLTGGMPMPPGFTLP
ncbi:MAG: YbaB/EbfC family nucleoid-associated protein [Xanthomonadaceae bacterium]|nr:YbaB/EbfC family nucleoid-associated protein [Xanthomonadaceae bacterium]